MQMEIDGYGSATLQDHTMITTGGTPPLVLLSYHSTDNLDKPSTWSCPRTTVRTGRGGPDVGRVRPRADGSDPDAGRLGRWRSPAGVSFDRRRLDRYAVRRRVRTARRSPCRTYRSAAARADRIVQGTVLGGSSSRTAPQLAPV
jgi:hypothetical protein